MRLRIIRYSNPSNQLRKFDCLRTLSLPFSSDTVTLNIGKAPSFLKK